MNCLYDLEKCTRYHLVEQFNQDKSIGLSANALTCEAILKMIKQEGWGWGWTCLMLFYRNCLGFQDLSIQQRENSIFSSNPSQEIILPKKGGNS